MAEAKKEGKVVLYGEIGPALKAKLIDGFEKKYGIEIEFVVGRPPEVAQRYLQERTANLHLADVFITGQTTTSTVLKPRGVLAPVRPHLVMPEVLDMKAWPEGRLPFLDADELVVPLISAFRSGVAVNTDLVKKGQLASYRDLLNSMWKEKITLSDPSMPGAGGTLVAFLMLKGMGVQEGEKYLQQLATLNPFITRDTRLHMESVARGKYSIGMGPTPQVLADLAGAGAPVAWAPMQEGGIVIPGGSAAALPDKPSHPRAAALMLNYLLSRDGQLAFSESRGEPARRLDVPTAHVLPGTMPQPGEKAFWLDEDFVLKEPTFYPLSREIFGIK
ncbi:MAG: extracellular solute-binding protein [Chloroflexi bacterium]|nr:extracellular solute-binding protein [Chloroflexota bacterium]